jgi:hypothetical protein
MMEYEIIKYFWSAVDVTATLPELCYMNLCTCTMQMRVDLKMKDVKLQTGLKVWKLSKVPRELCLIFNPNLYTFSYITVFGKFHIKITLKASFLSQYTVKPELTITTWQQRPAWIPWSAYLLETKFTSDFESTSEQRPPFEQQPCFGGPNGGRCTQTVT